MIVEILLLNLIVLMNANYVNLVIWVCSFYVFFVWNWCCV